MRTPACACGGDIPVRNLAAATEHVVMLLYVIQQCKDRHVNGMLLFPVLQADVEARVRQIRNLAAATEQEYEREKLNERIARLSGGVAIIQVR